MLSLRPDNVIRHLPWQLDSKAALGFLIIMAIFSLVGWLYLTQASAVTATSYRIDELRVQLDQIEHQNMALAVEIAQLEALPRIEARARELGFEPITEVTYLPVENYPTHEERLISPVLEDHRTATPESGPWWVDLLDYLTAWMVGDSA